MDKSNFKVVYMKHIDKDASKGVITNHIGEQVTQFVIDTNERLIRESLRELGWRSPEDVEKIKSRIKKQAEDHQDRWEKAIKALLPTCPDCGKYLLAGFKHSNIECVEMQDMKEKKKSSPRLDVNYTSEDGTAGKFCRDMKNDRKKVDEMDNTVNACSICGELLTEGLAHVCPMPIVTNVAVAKIPHKCPVCMGTCSVPQDFYLFGPKGTAFSTGGVATESCRSCCGTGIIWSQ